MATANKKTADVTAQPEKAAAKKAAAKKAVPATKAAAMKPVAAVEKAAAPKAKKAPVKKVAADKPAKTTAAKKKSDSPVTIAAEHRYHMIATAAYYLAQGRGFAGGYEMQDWISAEAQIDLQIKTAQ